MQRWVSLRYTIVHPRSALYNLPYSSLSTKDNVMLKEHLFFFLLYRYPSSRAESLAAEKWNKMTYSHVRFSIVSLGLLWWRSTACLRASGQSPYTHRVILLSPVYPPTDQARQALPQQFQTESQHTWTKSIRPLLSQHRYKQQSPGSRYLETIDNTKTLTPYSRSPSSPPEASSSTDRQIHQGTQLAVGPHRLPTHSSKSRVACPMRLAQT